MTNHEEGRKKWTGTCSAYESFGYKGPLQTPRLAEENDYPSLGGSSDYYTDPQSFGDASSWPGTEEEYERDWQGRQYASNDPSNVFEIQGYNVRDGRIESLVMSCTVRVKNAEELNRKFSRQEKGFVVTRNQGLMVMSRHLELPSSGKQKETKSFWKRWFG
jgi:hypothetical protein